MISKETYEKIKPLSNLNLLKKFDFYADKFRSVLNIDFSYKLVLGSRMHGECHCVLNDDGSETNKFLIKLNNKVVTFDEKYVRYLMYHELAHVPQFINYGTMFKHDACFYESYMRVVPSKYWKYEVDYIPSSKIFFNQVCTKF